MSSTIALAHIDGEAVATAVSITNAVTGVGGVYWVGTVPSARRRGAAEAVTRFVTQASFEQGACIVTLQASPAGAPLYARLGYAEVGRYARFLSPKSGSGKGG
jgi:predicted acetyltransferase